MKTGSIPSVVSLPLGHSKEEILTLLKVDLIEKRQAENLRDQISEGSYEVNTSVTIDLKGVLKIGADYESVVNQSIPYELLFGLALSHINSATLESLVKEGLKIMDGDEKQIKIAKDEVKEKVNTAIGKFKAATKKTCKGKVSVRDIHVTVR